MSYYNYETHNVESDSFRVHNLALAKKTRKRPRRKPAPVVTVAKAHADAVRLAHELAGDRDVHVEVQRDGSLIIRNGRRK